MSIGAIVTRGFLTSVHDLPTRGFSIGALAVKIPDILVSGILRDKTSLNATLRDKVSVTGVLC